MFYWYVFLEMSALVKVVACLDQWRPSLLMHICVTRHQELMHKFHCKGIRIKCVMYQSCDTLAYDHDHTCRVPLDISPLTFKGTPGDAWGSLADMCYECMALYLKNWMYIWRKLCRSEEINYFEFAFEFETSIAFPNHNIHVFDWWLIQRLRISYWLLSLYSISYTTEITSLHKDDTQQCGWFSYLITRIKIMKMMYKYHMYHPKYNCADNIYWH